LGNQKDLINIMGISFFCGPIKFGFEIGLGFYWAEENTVIKLKEQHQ
tara:strand:- start:82 stop:222 length:141 start_codon:yes stop_codon:yes gene_type:complete